MKLPSIISQWGLLKIFALSSFITIISISAVSGFIYFTFLQQNMLQREMEISSEFIMSISLINNPVAYFEGSTDPKDKEAVEEFFQHVIGIPDVFRATIYDIHHQIIWSNDAEIIGKTFNDNDELSQAYAGISIFKLGKADAHAKQEHTFLPEKIEQFVESYIPVRDHQSHEIIGVVELYKSPNALFETLRIGFILVLVVSTLSGFVLYWILFWIVRTAHHLIESQRVRIKQASSRAVELNEQHLRRIGSELHDGPAQSIGFALLKLDDIIDDEEPETEQDKYHSNITLKIQHALNDALQEIRSLSAGLVIPDLKGQPVKLAILKVIDRHEKRTSTKVVHHIKKIPDSIKTSSKICIYRLVQEGLNNAFHHGQGIDQSVSVIIKDRQLELTVQDSGPGINFNDIEKVNGPDHLGLRGMRERVESLGGHFKINNKENTSGVILFASLPIND